MPVIVQTAESQVTALWGCSYIRSSKGKFKPLKLGKTVHRGDVILTDQNAIVRLTEKPRTQAAPRAPKPVQEPAPDTSDMDRTIASLERGDKQAATAAGDSGSAAEGGFLPGTWVERVVETVAPAGMGTAPINLAAAGIVAAGAATTSLVLGTPLAAQLSRVQSIASATDTEDKALVFPVQLGAAAGTATTLPFKLSPGTASQDDIGAPLFSEGVVQNADGTITIPAGVSNFVVTVPLTDDLVTESAEAFTLQVGDQTATGTILDNDAPSVARIEIGGPGVTGDTVVEGQSLVYTVTLSGATAATSLYPFALGGGSAADADHGQPTFSDGVVLNADGTLSVPAGISSFSMTLPTVDDSALESVESMPFSVGGLSSLGFIADNDGVVPPSLSVNLGEPGAVDDIVTEGQDLVFNVLLSEPTTVATSYPFNVGVGTAGSDDVGQPIFSNGVVLNADGTITVPAGVSAFSVTVPTTQDAALESSETLTLTMASSTVTGTIVDDDQPVVVDKPSVAGIELDRAASPGIEQGSVSEGSDLVYNVQLSQATTEATVYPFKLGGGSAAADDIGQPVFSNGVVLNTDGTITVPAGVASFSVTVPTTQDSSVEPSESVPLTIDGKLAAGTIVDDDQAVVVDKPSVSSIELAPPASPGLAPGSVAEGGNLVYNVQLSQATTAPAVYPFNLGGGSAASSDFGQPAFSNGVVLNADSTITVPAGVTNFSVTVPTTQDTAVEPSESVPLTIDSRAATGTITDDDQAVVVDKPRVVGVEVIPPAEPAPGAGAAAVLEGAALVCKIQLSQATTAPVNYPFKLDGGTAEAEDTLPPVFSNGVVLNADGTVTVPAGVASFTVTVPTVQDTAVEVTESLNLTVDSVAATWSIVDDDKPAVVTIELVPFGAATPGADPDAVTEGGKLVYKVQLSQHTSTATTYPFELGGGTAAAADFGQVSFTNGVVLNADGTITVPADVVSFSVLLPTTQDSEAELSESVPLTIDAVSAAGVILDDDQPLVARIDLLSSIDPSGSANGAAVLEGADLVYSVKLSQATAAAAVYPFSQAGGTAGAGDLGTPVFSNGVNLNADGTITVPPGVDSFTVRVATLQDQTAEITESAPLRIGSLSTTASILDDDKPRVASVEPAPHADPASGLAAGSVVEGGDVVYTVALDQATVVPTSYALVLGGGTAGLADAAAPVFSHGVVLNPDNTITVPAGVIRFTMSLPTVQDREVEGTESVPLTIDGLSATGHIIDDDKPSVLRIEAAPAGAADPAPGSVLEGSSMRFMVQLSDATTSAASYTFDLGGGSAASGDIGSPLFSDGVVLNADGSITVPAGISSFSVIVPTIQDLSIEDTESLPLRIEAVLATASIVDDDANAAPLVQSVSAVVSEEGLPGGQADSTGQPTDSSNSPNASGRLLITDPNGDAITSVTLTAPTAALSSGGVALVWEGSGTANLVAKAGGETVATVSIDKQGQYNFSLLKPIDHAQGQGENVQCIDFGVQATDAGGHAATGLGKLSINVEDDMPVAQSITRIVTMPETVSTNVMLVLDVSGSMGQASGMGGLTRLQAAVQSIETLLDRYDAQGDVAVRLVTFGDQGKALGDCWTSVVEAKAMLACIKASGGTNYDDALGDAIAAFGAPGKLAGGTNVSYFLSDGNPTLGAGSTNSLSGGKNKGGSDVGIQDAEAAQWHQFLETQHIDSHAFAVGMGLSNVNALRPIAYDGITATAQAPQLVDDFSDLPSALLDTTISTTSGQLLGVGGADGAHLHCFAVDGVNYTVAAGGITASEPGSKYSFDAASQVLTVDTLAGGRFSVDFASGGYEYLAPTLAGKVAAERFSFGLGDADGDVTHATGVLQLQAAPSAPPASVTSVSTPAAVTEGAALEFEIATTSSSRPSTLELSLSGGTASPGVDTACALEVNLGSGWVSLNKPFVELPAQTTSLRVRVATVDDKGVEAPETVVLTAKGSDGTVASAEGRILDDDRAQCQPDEQHAVTGFGAHTGFGGLDDKHGRGHGSDHRHDDHRHAEHNGHSGWGGLKDVRGSGHGHDTGRHSGFGALDDKHGGGHGHTHGRSETVDLPLGHCDPVGPQADPDLLGLHGSPGYSGNLGAAWGGGDVFAWQLAPSGPTQVEPPSHQLTPSAEGLDLRDLLGGHAASGAVEVFPSYAGGGHVSPQPLVSCGTGFGGLGGVEGVGQDHAGVQPVQQAGLQFGTSPCDDNVLRDLYNRDRLDNGC